MKYLASIAGSAYLPRLGVALAMFVVSNALSSAIAAAQEPPTGLFPHAREVWEELSPLPREELMRVMYGDPNSPVGGFDSPRYLRVDTAFSILRARGGFTIPEIRELVDASVSGRLALHPRTLFTAIPEVIYESSATDEQKELNDELLRILPPQLYGPNKTFVAEGLFGMVAHSYDTKVQAKEHGIWPEIPYRNSDVIELLVRALRDDRNQVPDDLARLLGGVGANDPDLAACVIAAIDERLARGFPTDDMDELFYESLRYTMRSAKLRIMQDVEEFLSRGGELAEPEVWQSIEKPSQPDPYVLRAEEALPPEPEARE